MVKFIKAYGFYLIPIILIFLLIYAAARVGRSIEEENRFKVEIRLEPEQMEKLKEISKKDFRDVNHTLLMLADDYIKYKENNEVVKWTKITN